MKIYQIELTNHCNADCEWCPHNKMTREKGFIDVGMFGDIIRTISKFQPYVALHHFGESFLHPDLEEIINIVRSYNMRAELSTNGSLLLFKEKLNAIKQLDRIRVSWDTFRPIEGIKLLRKEFKGDIIIHSIFKSKNMYVTELKDFDNWAGCVDGESEMKNSECYYLTKNYGVILWDGRIVNCCKDYDGFDVIGTVEDDIEKLKTRQFSLCGNCKGLQFAPGGEWK